MMGDGCVRYVGLLGQADIRRRASIRSQLATGRRQAAATDTNSRKEQRHGAWGMGVMNGTVRPWHRITTISAAAKACEGFVSVGPGAG